MNREICKHEWERDEDSAIEKYWCLECGAKKWNECGEMRYRYPRKRRYTIYSAARKYGKKARRRNETNNS